MTGDLSEGLKNIIEKFSGEFTHVYAACGDIRENAPTLVHEKYLDDRRLFDLSSLTKALVTVPLFFSKIEDIQESIFSYVPKSIEGLKKSELTWLDLLSHESGLPFWCNLWVKQFDQQGQCLLKTPQDARQRLDISLNRAISQKQNPSLKGAFIYSDLGYLLLQRLLEHKLEDTYKEIVDDFLKEFKLDKNFIFHPDPSMSISTGYCAIRKRDLMGEVHDENAAALGGVCAHAGAFGSGKGVVEGLQKLLSSNNGQKLIQAQLDRQGCQIAHPGLAGWWQGNGESAKAFAGGLSIGHLGFTGTAFWYDPRSNFYGVLLTNRIIKGRLSNKITQLRSAVFKLYEQVRTRK